MSTSAPLQNSSSRARTQARKKLNDDAAYFGPSGSATGKRQAVDKVEGEPRTKRKKVDVVHGNSRKDVLDTESRMSLVEFHKMPMHILQRYLQQFHIEPKVYPSPLSVQDPPPPLSLLTDHHHRYLSRPPSPATLTPANRPRREPKDQNRRRSSRLLEDEPRTRAPILADRVELHRVLASVAEKHFRETTSISGREEIDILAAFMCAVEKTNAAKSRC